MNTIAFNDPTVAPAREASWRLGFPVAGTVSLPIGGQAAAEHVAFELIGSGTF